MNGKFKLQKGTPLAGLNLDCFDEIEEINVVLIFEVKEEDGDNFSLSIFSIASHPLIQREE